MNIVVKNDWGRNDCTYRQIRDHAREDDANELKHDINLQLN